MGLLDNLNTCSCGEKFQQGEKFCSKCGKKKFQMNETSDDSIITNKDSIKTDEESTKTSMTPCPHCGIIMTEGYIFSPNQMIWEELNSNMFTPVDKINDDASNIHFFSGNRLKASRCSSCRHIAIDY